MYSKGLPLRPPLRRGGGPCGSQIVSEIFATNKTSATTATNFKLRAYTPDDRSTQTLLMPGLFSEDGSHCISMLTPGPRSYSNWFILRGCICLTRVSCSYSYLNTGPKSDGGPVFRWKPSQVLIATWISFTLLLHPLCRLVMVNSPRPTTAMLQAFGDGMPVLWPERPIRRAD